MKAGVLSDTHDHEASALAALSIFARERVDVIFHLGDVTLPRFIEPFRGNGIPLVAVFGNCDADKEGLQRASGGAFGKEPRVHDMGPWKILLGHAFDSLHGEIGPGGRFDLILYGHTHRPVTMRVGRALVVNPGEACGLMSGRHTCAVVDLAARDVRILDIFERVGTDL
jgi:putative phosphoesterase